MNTYELLERGPYGNLRYTYLLHTSASSPIAEEQLARTARQHEAKQAWYREKESKGWSTSRPTFEYSPEDIGFKELKL